MKHAQSKIGSISIVVLITLIFACSASAQTSPSGLLWVYKDDPDPTMTRASIVVINRATNIEIKRFRPGANWGGIGCMFGRGVAYDVRDGNLWVTMNRGSCSTPSGGTRGDGFIHKINSWDGSDLGTIPDPTNTGIGGLPSLATMDYDAQDNALYGVSGGPVCYEFNTSCHSWVYKLNADTGAVLWKTDLGPFGATRTLAVMRDETGRKVLNVGYGHLDTATGAILKPLNGPSRAIDIDEITGQEVQALVSAVDISIQDGRCDCETIPRPPTQTVSSSWPLDLAGTDANWSMLVQVSNNDGLVLRDIKLGERYMAERISVPYYYLETSVFPKTRGELKPDGLDSQRRSRLVNFYHTTDDEKLIVEATYIIDQIPAGSSSCLYVTQRYEFYRTRPGDNCEPGSILPCSRWKPIVKYRFNGRNGGEFLNSFNIAQRQHRSVDNNPFNTVGVFQDSDGLGTFAKKHNPLISELYSPAIKGGKNARQWDNVHQTFKGVVEEPSIGFDVLNPPIHFYVEPGCPECIHSHWRWGLITMILGHPEGRGNLIGIPPGSNQDVDFAIVKNEEGEEDPTTPFSDLVQSWQLIRTYNTAGRNPLQVYRNSAPERVVYWQSGTGYQNSDTFFSYGVFFNPSLPNQQLYGGGDAVVESRKSNVSSDSSEIGAASVQEGITSIEVGQLFVSGTTTVTPFDANHGGPLPAGYSQYGNLSYEVTTDAEVTGPNTVTFYVPSVTEQNVFDNLRIFHLEQDPFDPAKIVWVDRTVLAPDPQAPDFSNKTINARANLLGQFVVASLTGSPPPTAAADIAVASADSPGSVVVGSDLTYTLTITNSGPQNASDVVFSNALSPQTQFVSVNSTQGSCTEVDTSVVCRLDAIAANNSASVTIVVKPTESAVTLPAEGSLISNTAFARANETDPDTNNNLATENTTILPDGNARPAVNITSPTQNTVFISPANLSVAAAASDSDGSISKVDFYGDGNLIGTGTETAPGQHTIAWTNVSSGTHSLIAVATDNLNKTTVSDPITIVVNGSAAVNLTNPANNTVFNRPANITVTANASLSGGTISKVDFYLNGVMLLGTGTSSGQGQYSLNWNAVPSGKHVLTAVATDSSNMTTVSAPVNLTVNDPPLISLVAPLGGTVFSPPGNINLIASANDVDGSITRVDFYANGSLIGTNSGVGLYRFFLNWTIAAPGNYSVTAAATDNHGTATTSAPVTIRVNTPPTANITSPSTGSQFTAPANITITANAADTDGTVSEVEFFANGYRIGTGTAIGGDQYGFTWTGVGIGNYSFTAAATDNDGATVSSSGTGVGVTSPVLFVAGSTQLNSTENVVKARLEALNHTVTVKSAASAVTADASGKALVVISSTVAPTSVGTKFRTVAVPILTWESGIYSNLGMTGSTNKDFGTKTNQTQVAITNPTHTLASEFSGNTSVASSGTFNWGKPNANAASAAIVVGDTTKTVIFGYDTGAIMPGLTAPARRVGFFLHDTTVLNSNGIQLLDSAIKWARGGGSLEGSLVVSQGGPVDLTTEGTIDWAHWGLGGPTKFDHKAGITPQISDYTKLGTSSVMWLNDNPTTFSWIDGTPNASIFNTPTGVFVNGVAGNGFEITVPADANLKTLKLYLGLWQAQGKLEATLSDGSAVAYVDTGLSSNTGTKNGVYTIRFKSGSNGQILKIRYTLLTNFVAPHGNVTLEAATLHW